jgi:hypothetical protein
VKTFSFVALSASPEGVAATAHVTQAEDYAAAYAWVEARQAEYFPPEQGWRPIVVQGHQFDPKAEKVNSATRVLVRTTPKRTLADAVRDGWATLRRRLGG